MANADRVDLSWKRFERAASVLSPDAPERRLAERSFSALRPLFTDAWLEKAAAAPYPPEVPAWLITAATSCASRGDLVELALRLELLQAGSRRFPRVRNALKTDVTFSGFASTGRQLALAGFARRLGWEVEFEAGAATDADLLVRTPTASILFESTVRWPAASEQHEKESLRRLRRSVLAAAERVGVAISGKIERLLTNGETQELFRRIRDASVGEEIDVGDAVSLTVRPAGVRSVVSTPVPAVDTWKRLLDPLRSKLAQSQRSGADWIDIEVRTSIWSDPSIAAVPLAVRLEAVAGNVRATLDSKSKLKGVVLSSGTRLFPRPVGRERATLSDGSVGLRFPLALQRGREVLVIVLNDTGQAQVDDLERLLATDCDWLAWGLNEAGWSDLGSPLLSLSEGSRSWPSLR